MTRPVGSFDDGGEVVTKTGAHGCHQQALTTGPGVAGEKMLVHPYHFRRTSAPAGGTTASVDGRSLLRWYIKARNQDHRGTIIRVTRSRRTFQGGQLPGRNRLLSFGYTDQKYRPDLPGPKGPDPNVAAPYRRPERPPFSA
ncbi:hypothetical protein MRX96_032375 [Rhipicephalus microplus]